MNDAKLEIKEVGNNTFYFGDEMYIVNEDNSMSVVNANNEYVTTIDDVGSSIQDVARDLDKSYKDDIEKLAIEFEQFIEPTQDKEPDFEDAQIEVKENQIEDIIME